MALIYPESGDGSSDQQLTEAQRRFRRATRALDKLVDELDDGELGHAGEAGAILKELKNSLQLAMAERERLESARRKDAGIVHDYAIDFDAARSEIGRRLACLRAAAGAGGVPE